MIFISPDQMGKDLAYTYAVGYIRGSEALLLSRSFLFRLAEAATLADLVKVLQESSYGTHISTETVLRNQYAASLKQALAETCQLLGSLDFSGVISLFTMRYDFHNLKLFGKVNLLGGSCPEGISSLGSVLPEQIEQAVAKRDFSDVPDWLAAAAEDCFASWAGVATLQNFSFACDKAYFQAVQQRLSAKQFPFLKQLFCMQIDCANLKTIIRVQRMAAGHTLLPEALIPGGLLDTEDLLACAKTNLETLSGFLELSPYEMLATAVQHSLQTGMVLELEYLMQASLVQYAEQAQLVSAGVEPLVAYLLAKELEIAALRLVFVSRLNNLPKQRLQALLQVFPLV